MEKTLKKRFYILEENSGLNPTKWFQKLLICTDRWGQEAYLCGLYIFSMPPQRIPKVAWLDKALSHVGPMTRRLSKVSVTEPIGTLISHCSSLSLYVKAK